MTDILEANSRDTSGQSTAFVITNLTAAASMDCSAVADNAIADTLGTLIRELQRLGIIHGTTATH